MPRLFFVLLFFAAGFARAQTTVNGSFVHDGITRTYSFYVPASYTPGNPVPLVIGLHGLSSSGADFAQYRDFRPIADTANFIMVHPDGSTLFGVRFWNYGNVLGSDVDDVGFLEALIDTIAATHSINPQQVYCTGMSNGSFMAYALACQSNRFAALGAVTGSMSVDMYESCTPSRPIPVLHIHGTSDNTNPYTGTSGMQAVEDVVRFWVNQNGCDTVPDIIPMANTNTGDGCTAERYLYSGGTDGHTVELFKVTGGGHSWPGSPMPGSSENTCMDFDARHEIWRFFSQYENTEINSVNNPNSAFKFSVSPNPTSSVLSIQSTQTLNGKVYVLKDVSGKIMTSGKIAGTHPFTVDVSGLKNGVYFLSMDAYTVKIIKH